ncbi:MAG TPA: methyltransferase domain-containing protein [Acidimicrobiales bacterium]
MSGPPGDGSEPGAPGAGDGYLLDNRQVGAGTRLTAISELFDPATFRILGSTGVGPGWRCWEIGAGGPTVASWLAERVGRTGSVLATDIDLSRMGDPGPGVTVRRHDVAADPLPPGPFDLIHARLLLVHLPDRVAIARSLAGLVRPGGWLVVEDADPALQPLACIDEHGPDQELANRVRTGFRSLLSGRGVDLSFGRTLPRMFRGLGLIDVEAEAHFPVTSPASAVLERATVGQTRSRLVAGGLVTDEDIDRHLENLAAGRLDVTTAPMVSTRGRRPLGDASD